MCPTNGALDFLRCNVPESKRLEDRNVCQQVRKENVLIIIILFFLINENLNIAVNSVGFRQNLTMQGIFVTQLIMTEKAMRIVLK